jgi:amidohydrolase
MKWHGAVLALLVLLSSIGDGWSQNPIQDSIKSTVTQEYSSLFELYKHLHSHPELSLHEKETAKRMANELRKVGCEVTEKVGGHGVVGVFKNGSGPTVLVRCDMDALPVKEQTELPYASKVTTKDDTGNEVSVMHACGHDIHMTAITGVARVLTQLRDRWSGTLVFIAQPAEEKGDGAKKMLADGLFTRFPKPNFCLALHDSAELPTGSVGYVEGYALANVDSVDITVRGVGGHGAYPHTTKDPVVLASQIVVALQTIVSREIPPTEPAVVTVGSFHAGTKHNIIPAEAKLQLTLRSYTDEVRAQTIEAVKRIARSQAISAGLPEDRLPIVTVSDEFTPATYNDPILAQRMAGVWSQWFGVTNVVKSKPVMGGEDFGRYGRTGDKVPCLIFWVGAQKAEIVEESKRTGKPLPSLHSPFFAPVPEPTIKTAVTAMCAAVLELTQVAAGGEKSGACLPVGSTVLQRQF